MAPSQVHGTTGPTLQPSSTPISKLPVELYQHIMSYLAKADLDSFKYTNHHVFSCWVPIKYTLYKSFLEGQSLDHQIGQLIYATVIAGYRKGRLGASDVLCKALKVHLKRSISNCTMKRVEIIAASKFAGFDRVDVSRSKKRIEPFEELALLLLSKDIQRLVEFNYPPEIRKDLNFDPFNSDTYKEYAWSGCSSQFPKPKPFTDRFEPAGQIGSKSALVREQYYTLKNMFDATMWKIDLWLWTCTWPGESGWQVTPIGNMDERHHPSLLLLRRLVFERAVWILDNTILIEEVLQKVRRGYKWRAVVTDGVYKVARVVEEMEDLQGLYGRIRNRVVAQRTRRS
ncbi:hypothetical protein BJ508DRAFT_328745 [Ascobolus immersus RN42]|uniref:F-box domain-containing protein n=1 Tax=Ascobolus immersus RN42 TaxID=1160509 RepID=A0A3N4I0V4_ASCIM|nr:hypothetical protein BJ508DRAFT_328745 [Ascobolus immersus RN42]